MTNILKIPANSQAYVFATRDAAQDKFDVRRFAYDFINAIAIPEPWAYWKMEEVSGTRIDATGHGHDLAILGTTVSQEIGKVGYATGFVKSEPSSAAISRDEAWEPSTNPAFTFAFWAKCHGTGVWYNYILELNSNLGISIAPDGSGGLTFSAYTSGPQQVDVSGISVDAWHFYVVYHNGSEMFVEVDNVPEGSNVGAHGISINYDVTYAGYPSLADQWSMIDEWGIWLLALTSDQRAYLWNSGAGRTLYP